MPKKLEEIKLSQYAKDNGMPYKKCWTLAKSNSLPVKTKISDNGRISVLVESKASNNSQNLDNLGKFSTPTSVPLFESQASTRRNKAATSSPTDEYYHIQNGVTPYEYSRGSGKNGISTVAPSDAIRLCQMAYYNFSEFKNTINLMTEFSTNKIFFRGGNSKSRKFFENWSESINLLDLQDKFFREFYRSSNVIIFKFESKIKDEDLKELTKAFEVKAAKNVAIPIKYIILNPADIRVLGNVSFSNANFFKMLNGYELSRLKLPPKDQTLQEKELFNSFDNNTKNQIKNGSNNINIPLDPSKIYAIFYGKQDYEGLAIPMGYPVLKDINWKAEMKHIDMAVSRTMQQVVLLVNMGYESKNGEYMFDQQAADAMRSLFESESVGKVLVADFTTKLTWSIPTLGDFLDPKKYQIVNEDIKNGLASILMSGGDSKFANQFIQTQIFIQRLQQARESFLTNFLIPEIKKISDTLNFKAYPKPFFQDFNLNDTNEFDRIVAQLYQLGLLTPPEALEALENQKLPNGEESLESQELFKQWRDKGYYEPVAGGPQTQLKVQDKTFKNQKQMAEQQQEHDSKMKTKELKHAAENPEPVAPQIHFNAPGFKQPSGKPAGKTGKQSTTRKTSPMKASIDEELYSLDKIKDNIIIAIKLKSEVRKSLLEKFNLKELDKKQESIANSMTELVMNNEPLSNWENKEIIQGYINDPVNKNEDRISKIDEIAANHGLSPYLASVLLESSKENNE